MPSPGGTTKTVSTQELSPEQRELMALVMPNVKDYMNKPLELYPGSTIAGLTPTQIAARESIAGAATGGVTDLTNNAIGTAQQLSQGGAGGVAGANQGVAAGGQAVGGLGEVLQGYSAGQGGRDFLRSGALLDPASNPILASQSQAALRPITENLTEKVLPSIGSQFVGNNMFGSSRQGIAEGMAIDEWQKQAGDITTNLQAKNFEQGLGAMLSSLNSGESAATSGIASGLGAGSAGTSELLRAALGSLSASPDLAQLAFLPGMTMEGLGASERSLEQAKLSETANRFTTEQMLPFLQAQDVANLAFGMGGGTATTTAQQQPAFDPLGTMLGLLMMPFTGGFGF